MTKTIFEEMGGTYRQVGDYLLPNITVPAEEEIEPIRQLLLEKREMGNRH